MKRVEQQIILPAAFQGLFRPNRYKIFFGGRGGGKCMHPMSKVIMADATLRCIKDIKVGDHVMGVDGLPRKVLDTTHGIGELYKIKQSPAIDYIVNEDHVLSLKKSNNSKKPFGLLPSGKYRWPNGRYTGWSDITNIKVTDVLKQSMRWGDHFRGYKCGCLQFPEQPVTIDPYFLGIWQGDGNSGAPQITSMDVEVIDYCAKYAKSLGGHTSNYQKKDNVAKTIGLVVWSEPKSKRSKHGKNNILWNKFKEYDLPNNKHIPQQYIYNSEQVRLELLAGFIDTDGYLKHNCYEIVQKSEKLLRAIWLIANTLGFKTNFRKIRCKCCNNGKIGDYWSLTISGNAWRIPVKIERKKINKKDCTPNKDFLVSKIVVEPQETGEYAGITTEGDHLYLLEDGTVTHNSMAFAIALIARAYTEKLRILCTREFQSSIADSVHRLLSDQIQALGLSKWFHITRTEITSTSGSQFIFKGLRHSIQEIKSTEGIDICWIEEGQVISEMSWEILIPTIRKENSELWISFNPNEKTDPTFKRFVEHTPPNSLKVKVGWEDNQYFPDVLDQERKYMLSIDPEAYEHVWGGYCRTISDAVIFRGRFQVETFPEPPPDTRIYFGIDFGFSVSPTAAIRCYIIDRVLYIDHEAWGIGVELDDTAEFLIKAIPGIQLWPIKADCARPETISHLRRRGFDVTAAEKWAGSVEDGLAVMKGFQRIVIHERCVHTAEEFRLYSYKVDQQTNEVLPIIVKKFDNTIDSIRYALVNVIKQSNVLDECQYMDYPT